MYCLILVLYISLVTAAPRVSRNCYTLCDLQKSQPANAVPRECNCSLSDLMNTESASQDITLLDDTEVYFVPAEVDLFQSYLTQQPFLISNPIKFNPRIKKGSGAKEISEESIERIETYEKRKTLIRISNDDESKPPSYLDLEIQDVASSDISVIQQGSFIPAFESAEQALVECLDLHILDFIRKYGSVENLNEFWEARNLQIYENLSNSDLNDKIKKYCSETEFLIEQSLQDIKRGVPKKKANFRYVHEDEDDISIKHETNESTESEKYNLKNINRKYENSLEGSSSLDNTDQTVYNTNETKSLDIIYNKTTATPKNALKDFKTEFDMDPMPSEVIFKTTKEINKSDFILDETASFSTSTTSISDVLSFGDTGGITEKPLAEIQEERIGQGIDSNLYTMPFGVNLEINGENSMANEIIVNKPIATSDATTIFPASTNSPDEEQSPGDIGVKTDRPIADTEERKNESIEFNFDKMSSKVNLKPNLKNRTSNINMTSDEPILGNITFSSASSKPRHKELSFGNKNSNSETSIAEKQEDRKLDLNTMLPEVITKSKNLINNSNIEMSSQESVLDNITFRPASTPKHKELALGDISSNAETFTRKNHGGGKYESKAFDLDTISSEILESVAGNEPILEGITFFPASTTPQIEKLSLEDIRNSATSMSGKEAQGKNGGKVLDLSTIPTRITLKASNDIIKHYENVADIEPKLDDFTYFSTAFTSSDNIDNLSLGDISSNTATSMTANLKARVKGKEFDLDSMPTEISIKSSNKINMSIVNMASDEPIWGSTTLFPASTTPKNEKLSLGDTNSNSETPTAEKDAHDKEEGTKLDFITTPSEIILKPSNNVFKPHLNVASNQAILDEVLYFPTASTSPQNEKKTAENASNSTERSMTGVQKKASDGDINLDLNTMASNAILNIASNESISNKTSKLKTTSNSPLTGKPLENIPSDTISNISSDEDITSEVYISTTPVTAIQPQRRTFRESEVQIPKIITKECLNNEVQSFITDNEVLPNNDFEHSDATTKSLQNKIKSDSSDDYSDLRPNSSMEVIDTTSVINKSYISGNLYFGSAQDLVPVRLLQTDSGKVSLGIDGHSLCKKLLQKPNSKSLLLSTLCDYACKMDKNNATCVSQ